jgi:hypothetical protein
MTTTKEECDRCHGLGYIQAFAHVENGICFKCRGDSLPTHVEVPSDGLSTRKYSVTLSKEGLPLGCSCPAGRRQQRCKHLARGAAFPVWRKVVRDHVWSSSRDEVAEWWRTLKESLGTDTALLAVIRTGFPNGHPVCHGLRENNRRKKRRR